MSFPCNKCETSQFCEDMGRCLSGAMFDFFGEADAEDDPVDLTADEMEGPKKIRFDQEVMKTDLSKLESDIIKAALK